MTWALWAVAWACFLPTTASVPATGAGTIAVVKMTAVKGRVFFMWCSLLSVSDIVTPENRRMKKVGGSCKSVLPPFIEWPEGSHNCDKKCVPS